MLLNDRRIIALCRNEPKMIEPFVEIKTICSIESGKFAGLRVPSFGLSSCGYDIRLNPEGFRIFYHYPRHYSIRVGEGYEENLIQVQPWEGFVMIPPNSYALGSSLEKFNIPRNICGRVFGKSTLARCGIIVNVTPLEPGWRGYLTIEISNSCPLPVEIPIFGGIAQVQFEIIDDPISDYGEGKYQDQGDQVVQAKV